MYGLHIIDKIVSIVYTDVCISFDKLAADWD